MNITNNVASESVIDCGSVDNVLNNVCFQSQYSSQEKLNQLPYHPNNEDLGLYAKHFSGPHEGHMISLDDNDGRHSPLSPFQRPRSRSLR